MEVIVFCRFVPFPFPLRVRFIIVYKVYNIMQKIKQEMYAIPEDATDFITTLKSEPGMHCDFTLDAQGRLVNVFWSTVEQQEACGRYGGCIQLDTTVFANR